MSINLVGKVRWWEVRRGEEKREKAAEMERGRRGEDRGGEERYLKCFVLVQYHPKGRRDHTRGRWHRMRSDVLETYLK